METTIILLILAIAIITIASHIIKAGKGKTNCDCNHKCKNCSSSKIEIKK